MLPIRDLLNRIRWDKEFGTGCFEIGYLDHVEKRIVRVSLTRIRLETGARFFFEFEDVEGAVLSIPFHRIREVYREGTLIWRRPL
jgi:uncharacterized protein (UPF0248 family)